MIRKEFMKTQFVVRFLLTQLGTWFEMAFDDEDTALQFFQSLNAFRSRMIKRVTATSVNVLEHELGSKVRE